MAADVSILAALFAGLIELPVALRAAAGAALSRLSRRAPRWSASPTRSRSRGCSARRCCAALLFVAGFSTVFVALGASASVIGALIRAYSDELVDRRRHRHHRHGPAFPRAHADRLLTARSAWRSPKPVGLWGAYVMGLAFAFGWTPCIGPILAAILAVAASEATVTKGAGLLAVYSLGLAFRSSSRPSRSSRSRHSWRASAHLGMSRSMGALLVLTGIAFLTGFVTDARASGCWRRSRRWAGSAESRGIAKKAAPAGSRACHQ